MGSNPIERKALVGNPPFGEAPPAITDCDHALHGAGVSPSKAGAVKGESPNLAKQPLAQVVEQRQNQ